jgi:hypothetical protein
MFCHAQNKFDEHVHRASLDWVRDIEMSGVEFIAENGGGVGVRLRKISG